MVRGRARAAATLVVLIALITAAMGGAAMAQTKLNLSTSGFPIKITKAGSYFLVSNLIANAKNVNVIDVTVSNVSIDLNGFRIGSPGSSGSTGIGVNASGRSNVTVENGSVSVMGSDGIRLGANGVVRNVQANSNGGNGINCTGSGCLVTGCTANSNGASGLNFADAKSGYNENVMSGNATSPVSGGTSLGSNVCNGGLCP
jgi:hypothetical protein